MGSRVTSEEEDEHSRSLSLSPGGRPKFRCVMLRPRAFEKFPYADAYWHLQHEPQNDEFPCGHASIPCLEGMSMRWKMAMSVLRSINGRKQRAAKQGS